MLDHDRSKLRPIARRAGWHGAGSFLLIAAGAWSTGARAEFELIPYASSGVQYDSNVYRVSSTDLAPQVDGKPARSDAIVENIAGLDTNYLWGEQKLHAEIEGRRFDYTRISELSRYEYLLGTGLNWVLLSNVDGTLDFRQERKLAQLADIDTIQRIFNRDRLGGGQINITFANDWRAEGAYHIHDLLEPLPGFPEMTLRENTATGALKYLGVAKVTAGISGEYVNGSYRGSAADGNFDQYSEQLTLSYEATGLSSFNLNLGYTTRDDPAQGGTRGEFTGNLAYKRQLTGKTSLGANVFRRIESYQAGTNSVVETGGNFNIDWEATSRITVGTFYEYTNGDFSTSSLGDPTDDGRHDKASTVTLNATYKVLRWLQLRTYGTYQDRRSTVGLRGYNDTLAGLELSVRFQ